MEKEYEERKMKREVDEKGRQATKIQKVQEAEDKEERIDSAMAKIQDKERNEDNIGNVKPKIQDKEDEGAIDDVKAKIQDKEEASPSWASMCEDDYEDDSPPQQNQGYGDFDTFDKKMLKNKFFELNS